MNRLKKKFLQLRAKIAALPLLLYVGAASATTTSSLPWDHGIGVVVSDMEGPVAHFAVTAAIVGTGIVWAFGDHGSSLRKLVAIIFGGSMMIGAGQLVAALGFSSGMIF